ncbi:MAG: sortase [Actinomycetota bacterium]
MASTRLGDAFSLVFGAWGTRPLAKRIVTVVALLMLIAGAGLIAYPTVTDLYSSRQQQQLASEFTSSEFKTQFASGSIVPGQVLSRIEIPAIRVEALFVEGTEGRALRAGAGHYAKTPLPCEEGNVAIAGHRTTFGKPFNRIDELKGGEVIKLVTPERQCSYRVVIIDSEKSKPRPIPKSASWITDPGNVSVLNRLPGSMLTLTTCHPKRSAKQRLILRAELIPA